MILNKEQEIAVKHVNGPMLVLAGAGSGKTRVLTNRIGNLIDIGISPANILAITFTNKAACEMRERIFSLIGNDAKFIQISTFHSLGLKIIKENYEILGYKKNFIILDSDDVLTVIKKIMKDMNLNPKFYNAKDIRNRISNAKNELIEASNFNKIEYDEKIINVYKKYEKILKEGNSVDFDDLLLLPIKLFKLSSSILESYQERYKYILIDEYQDTNEAQYIFSRKLSKKYNNIFVVGDNDQAIYAFRGANYKNILNFEKDYPNCQVVMLEENYRSTQTILNAANSVIRHNKSRKDKNLWSNNEVGEKIKYVRVDDEKCESDFIVKEIKELVKNGVAYSDICILYRTNAQSRVLEEGMLKFNIPYKIVGSFYFYSRKEIKDLLSYLRIINNPNDDLSLSRVINVPKRGIGNVTIGKLNERAETLGCSMFEAIISGKELGFKNLILDLIEESKNLSLTELVETILEKSGLREELKSEKSLENDIRLENLEEFKSITKSYEEEYGEISLDDFLNEVSLSSDVDEVNNNDINKVNLMTIHAVKGLEYNYVFIAGMEEGVFPHFNSIMEGTREAMEEERRLCYVAITRAKRNLWIINAKRRMLFGKTDANPPSRFIEEIDSKYVDSEKKTTSIIDKARKFTRENMFVSGEVNYNVGDKVMHDEYGEGVITAVDKKIITIAFSLPIGVRKFIKNHKSIKKI